MALLFFESKLIIYKHKKIIELLDFEDDNMLVKMKRIFYFSYFYV